LVVRSRISKKNGQYNDQKKNRQKDKQRSTKHIQKIKARVTRTPLKTGCELRCSGRVSSSCSTSGTHRINLVTNPVISHVYTENMLELFWQCCIFIVFHFISLELPIIQIFIAHLLWKEFIQNRDDLNILTNWKTALTMC
jgi:hypothetical protein